MPDLHESTPTVRPSERCTIVMVAQDEESRIDRSLAELRRHGFPVVVVDGGSKDTTVQIAEHHGARVLHRPFDNMSNQLNWGIEQVETDYVMVVDADEVMSPELAEDIQRAIPQGFDGAWVTRFDYFAGRWLAHYPQRHIRLFRRGTGRYENDTHQRYTFSKPDPTIVEVWGPLTHPSHMDVAGYITKLNRYTDVEQPGLLRGTPSRLLVFRATAEAIAAFIRWYFVRSGWRDGRHGFIHGVYLGMYRFTLWAKAATATYDQPPTPEEALRVWRRTSGEH